MPYSISVSTATTILRRIAYDRQSAYNILTTLGDIFSLNSKLISLGKFHDNKATHPIKIAFASLSKPDVLLFWMDLG